MDGPDITIFMYSRNAWSPNPPAVDRLISVSTKPGQVHPMKIGFDYPESRMPRTIFYERVCEHIRSYRDFVGSPQDADLIFPNEDTAFETNWPCYARPSAAFIRGSYNNEVYQQYLQTLAHTDKRMCLINMHPFIRVPHFVAENSRIAVADINLRSWERSENPRTISMPALPITVGRFDPAAKSIFASFRGVQSHPTRDQLACLHNGTTFVCELVERDNHFGKLDAETNQVDGAYVKMLNESIFAFVPRGDAEFSYRLLEVMSFGCIPVVISDGLVLPFDRTIDWYGLSLHIPENCIAQIPAILENIPPARVAAMQRAVVQIYASHLSGFGAIVRSLLSEAEAVFHDVTAPRKSIPSIIGEFQGNRPLGSLLP